MLKFGANPPTHLYTHPPPPRGGGVFRPLSNSLAAMQGTSTTCHPLVPSGASTQRTAPSLSPLLNIHAPHLSLPFSGLLQLLELHCNITSGRAINKKPLPPGILLEQLQEPEKRRCESPPIPGACKAGSPHALP